MNHNKDDVFDYRMITIIRTNLILSDSNQSNSCDNFFGLEKIIMIR